MQTRIEMQLLSIHFMCLSLPGQTAIFLLINDHLCSSLLLCNAKLSRQQIHHTLATQKREVLSTNDKSAGWVPHLLILATLDKIQEKPPLEEIGAGHRIALKDPVSPA